MAKEKLKQMIRKEDAFQLYHVLSASKTKSLDTKKKVAVIMLQGKLKSVVDDKNSLVEEVKKSTSEQDFQHIAVEALNKWGKEEVEIDTKILTDDDCEKLVDENDFVVSDQAILYNSLR